MNDEPGFREGGHSLTGLGHADAHLVIYDIVDHHARFNRGGSLLGGAGWC
jgi:hypothetical protein